MGVQVYNMFMLRGDTVGSLRLKTHDPVTTDPKGETVRLRRTVTRRALLTYIRRKVTDLMPMAGTRYSLHHTKLWNNVRCRLITSWGWRRSQGFGCSPIKVVRELGSERRETVWPLSSVIN